MYYINNVLYINYILYMILIQV